MSTTPTWATAARRTSSSNGYNNVTAPAYHRLDIGVDIHHRTKHGHERIWNWSIYNAYCHLNTMWVDVNYDNYSGTFKAKTKGYIPIIPSFSYTYKF